MEFKETLWGENKPISGDRFIIEMGGAFLCVVCDFVAGRVDTKKAHMILKHNVEFKGKRAQRTTKQKPIKSNALEEKIYCQKH